jgi:hypothetical protein
MPADPALRRLPEFRRVLGMAGRQSRPGRVLLCMTARVTGGEIRLSEEHDQSAWVPLLELAKWQLPEQVRPLMLGYAQRQLVN